MSLVRALTAVPVAFFVAAVAFACGGDDSANNTSSGGSQPSSCPSPCTPGAPICYQPDPSSLCNGDWYCWDDSMWHCAPPDSGGPGDATVMFDTGGGSPEAGDDGPATGDGPATSDAEAGAD
jgi:hypothetical protein